ncbi:MAG TPA: hypothetical protein VIO95_00745 [Mycobacterium sp.]
MTIDTSTDALLEEAEAIVRAEWLRLRESEFFASCAELPAVRSRAIPIVVTVALDQRDARLTGGGGQWPARRRARRVWPSQRSPPEHHDPH